MGSDYLPPGCDDTPGDSYDDIAWESLYEQIGEDCAQYGWDSTEARDAWEKGVAYKRDE
jgi:hypothetical protein